jgi:hypothetical protein
MSSTKPRATAGDKSIDFMPATRSASLPALRLQKLFSIDLYGLSGSASTPSFFARSAARLRSLGLRLCSTEDMADLDKP